jgi:hypothetical protein
VCLERRVVVEVSDLGGNIPVVGFL